MKFWAVWVHCLGLDLSDCGRNPHGITIRTGKRGEIFLSGKQHTILPISRRANFTTFEHNMSIGEAMNAFRTEFWKFSSNQRFFSEKRKKSIFSTSCDFRPPQLCNDYRSTEIHYQMIHLRDVYFPFYRWNHSKSLPWPVHSVQERYLQSFFCVFECDITTCYNVITMSWRSKWAWPGDVMRRRERGHSVDKITAIWVMTHAVSRYLLNDLSFPSAAVATTWIVDSSLVGHSYVSNAVMTLATVSATIQMFFFSRYAPRYPFRVVGTDVEMCKSFNLKKTLYSSNSTVAQTAERFKPSTVLWAFHTIPTTI